MRRMVFLAVLVAAVGVGVASAALAVASPTVNDPRGDSSGGYADIKSVSVVVSSQWVTWTITAYGSFALRGAPCVVVETVRPAGVQWLVCGNAGSGFGVSTRGTAYGVGGGYAGKAGVSRLKGSPSTVVYRVPRQTFVRLKPAPKGFAWHAESLNQATGQLYDRVPNRSAVALPLK